jgi:hypothetical protein
MAAIDGTKVYQLPLVDVNWVNFAPMYPSKNYLHDAPPVEQCANEIDQCVEEMRNTVGSKIVYTQRDLLPESLLR